MDSFYCPFCQRNISPAVDDEGDVIMTADGGVIFVHDEGVNHDDEFNFGVLQ
ncbi:MAG: hypothetical protein ACRCYD_01925 [Plesiomonas sp.]